MSREQHYESNLQAYNADNVAHFDHPEFSSMARLLSTKILTFDPDNGAQQVDGGNYTRNMMGVCGGPIENVNHNIWTSESRTLDFACGVGKISLNIAPYSGNVVGLDLSPDMVAEYNKRVPSNKGQAQVFDLLAGDANLDQLGKFDQAVCNMSYHHIPDTQLLTKKVASTLKPGGWLFVVDFEGPDTVNGPIDKADVVHPEMSKEIIVDSFNAAGLKHVSVLSSINRVFWVPEPFIGNTCRALNKQKAESRVGDNGVTEYKTELQLALVAGQK